MRLSLGARVKVRLIQALVASLGKRNFSLPNGQVFHLRYQLIARVDPVTGKTVGPKEFFKVVAGIHFGHASRLKTDPPLVKITMDMNQWPLVLANVEEINGHLDVRDDEYEEVKDD